MSQGWGFLNVVWLRDPSTFEGPWVSDRLLARTQSRHYIYPRLPAVGAKHVLIVFTGLRPEPSETVIELLDQFPRAALLILSDQKMRHKTRRYRRRGPVLRPHFTPFAAWGGGTYAVPLGYHFGFRRKVSGRDEAETTRDYPWAFLGHIKNESREKMLAAFSKLRFGSSDGVTHFTTSFAGPDALDPHQVARIFDRTHFVPCPLGFVSPDSFRVMEALERGAVPVVVKFYGFDYFRFIYGEHPFVVGDDWDDASRRCAAYLSDPDRLEGLHRKVDEWYAGFLDRLQEDVYQILVQRAAPTQSLQFAFQQRGRFGLRHLAAYWYHFRFPGLRKSLYRRLDNTRAVLRKLGPKV